MDPWSPTHSQFVTLEQDTRHKEERAGKQLVAKEREGLARKSDRDGVVISANRHISRSIGWTLGHSTDIVAEQHGAQRRWRCISNVRHRGLPVKTQSLASRMITKQSIQMCSTCSKAPSQSLR